VRGKQLPERLLGRVWRHVLHQQRARGRLDRRQVRQRGDVGQATRRHRRRRLLLAGGRREVAAAAAVAHAQLQPTHGAEDVLLDARSAAHTPVQRPAACCCCSRLRWRACQTSG
jgi:hypothetical protein